MKNSQNRIYLSIFFVFIINFLCIAQKETKIFYWAGNEKVEVSTDDSKLILISKKKINPSADKETIKRQSDEIKSNLSKAENNLKKLTDVKKTERIGRKELIVELKDGSDFAKLRKEVEATNADFEVSPAYKYKDSLILYPSAHILLLPKPRVSIEEILSKFKNRVELAKPPYSHFYTLAVDVKDCIKISNELHESGLVKWVQPDFFLPTINFSTPNDPLYSSQWNLEYSNDNDINASGAWDITKGESNLIVSVIDNGVENHEDLNDDSGNSRVLNGIRLNPDNTNPSDWIGGGYPITSSSDHGQHSAGVIAASHNDKGGAGVAPNVRIFPVNRASRTISRDIYVRYEEIAEAITRSWQAGASVINMSIGVGNSSESPHSPVIEAAIDQAKAQGRGGRGTVLVASIGNIPTVTQPVYPAKDPDVIAVGASNRNGNIHSYSVESILVDLVAPSSGGISPGIITTDLMGSNGFSSGNYHLEFTGTSASAPQVAGVAALMLSVNNNLTANDVESIMKIKAKNLGEPVNKQGSGLVRACESVFEAMSRGASVSAGVVSQVPTSVTLNGLQGISQNAITWHIVSGTDKINPPHSGTGSYASLQAFQAGTAVIEFNYNHNCGSGYQSSSIQKTLTLNPIVTSTGCGVEANKCYKIKPVMGGLNLEVAGGGTASGENIWQNYANNCGNQVFRVEQTDENQYCKLIAQYNGGRAWELSGVGGNNATTIGAEVKNYDYNGNSSQKFYFSNAGGGAYHISTKAVIEAFGGTSTNYHYLDVFGGNSNPNNKLGLWYRHGGDNQRFILEETGCSTSCSGNGGGGTGGGGTGGGGTSGGGNTCGMSISYIGYNCGNGILETFTVAGVGANEELQYRADAGSWYDYQFQIQHLSAGQHTFYVRKKYDPSCQASIVQNICGGGSGGGGNSGGGSCPAAGCLSIGYVGYNCGNGILEAVVVSGGSGQYQYALDNCNDWKDYQFQIQQISNGSHTLYVRDQSNINCGDFKTISISCNNMRQGNKEDNTSTTVEEFENDLIIYPNPANEEIEVSYFVEKEQKIQIDLVDITGKVIQSKEVKGKGQIIKEKFMIKNQSSGQYFINIKSNNRSISKRFYKE